ncbi:hypothetical protein MASR1M12_10390 [Erysipelotrichia bacterium]
MLREQIKDFFDESERVTFHWCMTRINRGEKDHGRLQADAVVKILTWWKKRALGEN